VFDIGGGISVVRAAHRTANPRKAASRGNDGQQSLPLFGRTGNPKIKTLALKDGSDIQPLLPGTDFRRLKIPRGSSFIDLDLRGAIFDGLDLSGVKPNIPVHKQRIHFSGADLRGASFRGADLRNAIFMSAVVDGNTDFTGAIVDGADFAGAVDAVLSPQQLAVVLRRPDYGQRTGNPHGGGLVSGYGINTFAMDPDDYALERQSNPRESIATMLGRPAIDDASLEQHPPSVLRGMLQDLDNEYLRLRQTAYGLTPEQREDRMAAINQTTKAVQRALDEGRHYRIVRRYTGTGKMRILKSGVTLQEAQAHCNDPNNDSETATSAAARAITLRNGPWFDTYEKW
jgi:hypothetical protein